ncbi:peptidase S8 and S53 subtilisin kexin sedolisin [Beutenbergia cavernae DSM 12333]|uniref:Peptidase S8 and S53 subtilisin kexin sedolisin n=1 Tax=Beutenbergia cavernae (strain ATCC BAA-8 / DSM 12333 / CCUG 43141 / JCM 11478 / NBRC 16432 / NCIMB 13614 / HKI 0122) TaxID=471853 RepID=C5C0Q0_BEUC1|nr:S8 family serine peptidase [Beutenbergia cavernae]ACQ81446.1 peptidase S8 and S53 subtilisin kexin sedolisin [Beutenbergia cavernae DSM 12333]
MTPRWPARAPARLAAVGLLAAGLVGGSLLAPAAQAPAAAQPTGQCDEGILLPDRPWALDALGADEAHELATGRGVTVAVVDSGVQASNPHFAGDVVLPGIDVVGIANDARTDTFGHGTAVAGFIAAQGVDGSGVVGLAPQARILPVRVYYATGDQADRDGTQLTSARIAAGIRAAADAGAQIIAVAISQYTDDPGIASAVADATAAGSLVVASMGNVTEDAPTPERERFPAAYPGVLAVGSVAEGFVPVPDQHVGPHADVAAPGVAVPTTHHAGIDCDFGEEGGTTSWATGYAAAAAALVAERYPDETPAQWTFRLTATASRLDPDTHDDTVGWGVVQPWAALTFVDDGTARGPDSPTHERPSEAPSTAPPAVIERPDDPLTRGREVTLWVVLGVGAVVVCAVLLTRRPSANRR